MKLRSGHEHSSTDGEVSVDENSNKNDKLVGRTLGVMFVALVIDLLAFTMILPLLPTLLEYYGQNDKGGLYDTLNRGVHGFRNLVGAPDTPRWNSVLFGGLIGSMFSFLQFLAAPVVGAASDAYGRRPLLLLSAFGMAASYTLWALSSSFLVFVLARIVGGLSKVNVSLSTAVVADVCPPHKRGRGMALIGIAFSVGFLLGPLIGAGFAGWARSRGGEGGVFYTAPALFALTLAAVDIVFLVCCFKETLPKEKRVATLGGSMEEAVNYLSPTSLFRFTAVRGLSATDASSVRRLGLVYFLYLFFYSGLEFTLTFLTHNRFQYDSLQQGKMFFMMGVVMIIVQGGFVRRIRPGKEVSSAKVATALLIPSFILIGLSHHQAVLYTGLLLFSVASAVVVPCLTSKISVYGSVDQKGVVMGIFRSLGALARALGPMAACTVYWSVGAVPCYSLGALCLLLPLTLLSPLTRAD